MVSVIMPTAAVGTPASRLILLANGTWYPAPAGIAIRGAIPPDEQSIKSTPRGLSARASSTLSSIVHPPCAQSVVESRTNRGRVSGQTARTAVTISFNSRVRFRKLPPYSSVRLLLSGERNE